jgi:CotH protein/lamin tail-like protein
MNRYTAIFFLTVLPCFLQASQLPVININISAENLASLDLNPESNDTYPAVFTDDTGRIYNNVQVRYRGASSRNWPKKCWKIYFNEGDEYNGALSINLNSGWGNDPTRAREHLGYVLYNLFDSVYCESRMILLQLNDEFHGVYVEVEQPGITYLGRNGRSSNGVLYKAVGDGNLSDERVLNSIDDYKDKYEKKTRESETYDDLITWIEAINSGNIDDPTQLFNTVDLHSFTKYLCAACCLSNWDSISKNHYNFNPAPEKNKKWECFPWDLDRTWGEYPSDAPPWEAPSFWSFQPIFMGRSDIEGPSGWNRLWNRYFRCNATKRYYSRMLRKFCYTVFNEHNLHPLWDESYLNTKDDMIEDWEKWGSSGSPGFGFQWEIEREKRYISERRQWILGKLPEPEPMINEIMASNSSTISDEYGEFDDWIEIYNPASSIYDLSGCYLSDNFTSPTRWKFPASAKIAPGEYLLVWCDNDPEQGAFHTNFNLSATGEGIGIFDSDINGNLPIDRVEFGAQKTDISFGRDGDASYVFTSFTIPNPEQTNGPGRESVSINLETYFTHDIIVNTGDIGPANNDLASTDHAFIENGLDNARGFPPDRKIGEFLLGDYSKENAISLHDRANDLNIDLENKKISAIRILHAATGSDGVCPFEIHYLDGTHDSFTLNLDSWKNDYIENNIHTENLIPLNWMDRSNVELDGAKDVHNRAIFSRRFKSDINKKVNFIRFKSSSFTGEKGWVFAVLVDPLQPVIRIAQNIFINEWMADNTSFLQDEAGDFDDWIELFNANSQAVDIGGLYLSDEFSNPEKWRIPDGTSIPGYGFLLIWCDNEMKEGMFHAAFKLSAAGEDIGLFDRDENANKLIHSISFGVQAPDISSGLYPDGNPEIFFFNYPSPDKSNIKNPEPVKGLAWFLY